MKKSVNINLNLSNRAVYTILTILLVLAAGVTVYAFTDANGVGHDATQLDLSGVCNSDGTNCLIESRTTDPALPATGRIWLRSDI